MVIKGWSELPLGAKRLVIYYSITSLPLSIYVFRINPLAPYLVYSLLIITSLPLYYICLRSYESSH